MCYKCCTKSLPNGLIWNIISCVTIFIVYETDSVNAIRKGSLLVPTSYTSGSSDLHIQLHSAGQIDIDDSTKKITQDLRLQVTRLNDDLTRKTIAIIDVLPDPRLNITQIAIGCQYLLYGGGYELEIIGNDIFTGLDSQDERLKQQLDVRWPMPKLSVTPESFGTYPENPISVILEFPGVECTESYAVGTTAGLIDIPEFWLELYYCGHDVYCDSTNVTSSQVLYAEQVRGYPKVRLIKLGCELFGLAGNYIVKLRPMSPVLAIVSATAYVKADWSEQFVFNVHARSISPCDPHTGIGVLFEYPACILDRADRVRVFAKQRADVASLAPPTSLHYVSEQRVVRGQHSMHFDCDLFNEKYIEYCFVYVSQAISGAVADVRMDCLPTLPVGENDVGGWGPWSEWTPCSTTCVGGTKNRYRVCDSPPPRYGAKFCQGPAVETDHCGGPTTGSWECMFGNGNFFNGNLPVDRPEIKAEIGPGCRCGCIVHLSVTKPKRIIASSAESCPGRTFWLIQADDGYRIRFTIDFFRLICPSQYLKIRDGDSLASELIFDYIGGNDKTTKPTVIMSSDSQTLIEFYSNELSMIDDSCKGGFLTHAHQIQHEQTNMSVAVTSKAMMPIDVTSIAIKLTLIHIMAILFASIIIVVSALLGAQYIFRYRKYQLAENLGEPDSPAHTPRASLASIQLGQLASRAASTSTLLSEVVSLVKFRPRDRMKHARLRESIDCETMENYDDNSCFQQKSQSDDELSVDSSNTLRNDETINDLNNPHNSTNKINSNINCKRQHLSDTQSEMQQLHHSQSPTCSPPNRNAISLPPTPIDTPIPCRKIFKKKYSSTGSSNSSSSNCGVGVNRNIETKSMNGKSRRIPIVDVSPVREEDTEIDTELAFAIRQHRKQKRLCSSNVTLTKTNSECNSPAPSVVSSTAAMTIRNIKDNKEKSNREKLMAGPGSEFSLANAEDFELDYYDYNVINAGAAPGSYLGMDPAYLVWIPPIDDGNIIEEMDDENDEPHYEEISSKYSSNYSNTGSITPTNDNNDETFSLNSSYERRCSRTTNVTSPTYELVEPPMLPPLNNLPHRCNKDDVNLLNKNNEINKIIAATTLRDDCTITSNNRDNILMPTKSTPIDTIQMEDLSTNNYRKTNGKYSSPARVHSHSRKSSLKSTTTTTKQEKETAVVKSPSDSNMNDYCELDDIQFADDDEEICAITAKCDNRDSDMQQNNHVVDTNNSSSCV